MLILYSLIRTDMCSMKFGKSCAQAMHAANLFTHNEIITPLLEQRDPNQDVIAWTKEANGFGTTLTLAVSNLATMEQVIEAALFLGFPADIVIDPTYPYIIPNEYADLINPELHTEPMRRTGDNTVCFRSEKTCAYIFGDKDKLSVLLDRFKLIPND